MSMSPVAIPVIPGVDDCLRACGNRAESPQNSAFQLCEDCADLVYRLFIAPAVGHEAMMAAYRNVVEMYGRGNEEL